jgi:large repetitive protein
VPSPAPSRSATAPLRGQLLPDFSAYAAAPAAAAASGPVRAHAFAAAIASVDEKLGVPSFMWAPRRTAPPWAGSMAPAQVARIHLEAVAPLYRLSLRTLDHVVVASELRAGPRAAVVRLKQEIDGLPVVNTGMNMLLGRDNRLVAVAGRLHPDAVGDAGNRRLAFAIGEARAVSAALSDLEGIGLSDATFAKVGDDPAGFALLDLTSQPAPVQFTQPARVRRAYYALPAQVVPAFEIELDVAALDRPDSAMVRYVINGHDASLLERENLTHSESFDYRVWADSAPPHTPLDGPVADVTPHPTGEPDGYSPPFVDPILLRVEGLNHNANGGADPWLPAGATETTGNNVDAYADHNGPDGFSPGDLRASLTGPFAFDRTYDVTRDPVASDNQIMAAVTQLFYVTNWLHDWYYDSGFDEQAGNGQRDNYGRGGIAGDPLRAEAQDTGGQATNNANMATPADGRSPRMQMFLWTGPSIAVGQTQLEVVQPPNLAGAVAATAAPFGPSSETSASGQLAVADDGEGTSSDGCEAITGAVTGAVALIDRGACPFVQKALNAQTAGAVAAIIVNNDPTEADVPPPLGGDSDQVTIPVIGVSLNAGAILKDAAAAAPTMVTLSREGRVTDVRRDGTIDNGIVAHEWGHYLHNRLNSCRTLQCRGHGEGWGDFVALHMMIREGDNFNGTYAVAAYSTAVLGDNTYYGIRRVPYSTDFGKNALTFRHISDGEPLPTSHPINSAVAPQNSETHNAGEVWATMLHEAQVALLADTAGPGARRTFAQAHRRMTDYVVAGLAMAPSSPTYTEQRDAILAAAAANDPADFAVLARAFARRGAGSGAVSPPRDSLDLRGVVESYEVKGEPQFVDANFDDRNRSCDNDSVLDANETGTLTVRLLNAGAAPLTNTKVTVSSSSSLLAFPAGPSARLAVTEPFELGEVTIAVALGPDVAGVAAIPLRLEIEDPDAVTTSFAIAIAPRVNYDDQPQSSATDDVESAIVAWTIESAPELGANAPWARARGEDGNHVWHAANPSGLADERLVSPPLQVGTGAFTVELDHRYQFESSALFPGLPATYWDGAVIELSTDDGATWADVGSWVDPGYPETISGASGNPLGNRPGLVGTNPSWPATDSLTLDFDDRLAGQTVRLRFRVGADASDGAYGWDIDNIRVGGIVNQPFSSLQPNGSPCADSEVSGGGESAAPNAQTPDARADGAGQVASGGGGCATTGATGSPLLGLLGLTLAVALRRRRRR